MAKKIDNAMNVLGTVAAVSSFLNLNSKTPGNSKLTNFYASLKKHSMARTNRFEVLMSLPKILASYNNSESHRLLQLRCDTASVPGVTLTTEDVRRYGYGLSEKIPTGAQVGDFSCSFIGDAEGLVYKLFYRWMNGIVKWDEKPNASGKISYNKLRPYEFEYKENYASIIQLLTYDENEDKLLSYTLYDAFPVAIGEIQYNWGDNDNLVRIPVNFAYSYFKVDNIDEDIVFKPGAANELGLIGTLVKVGTAVQTLASLRKPRSVADALNVANNAKLVIGNLKL